MTRTRKWLVGIAICLLLLVTAVYFFDWNLARPYIARKVTSSTGRSFVINGDLDVRLSLRPRIIANDVAPNWVFGQTGKQQEFPAIDALAIDHGTLKFRDPTINTDLDLELNTLA